MPAAPVTCPRCERPVEAGFRYCPSCGTDTTDPGARTATTSLSDQLLRQLRDVLGDRYEVHELLGRGGMGAVFRATEKKLSRQVAIKVLPPELAQIADVAQRFEREARTAAQLDHPNIVPIYSVEDEGNLPYFVMKFVKGHPLDDDPTPALPWERVREILYEAATALGHAHARGIVHRDVKPGNIMVDEDGRILLADFGISKAYEGATKFTATGAVIGTPAYMSPEQSAGEDVDGRSDQYSLGIVGYSLLAGRLPFEETSVPTYLFKQMYEEPPPLAQLCPDAPTFLVTAITRALAKKPELRFPTMEDFAAAVWPERAGFRPGAATRDHAASSAGTPRRRWTWPIAAAVVVVVAAGGAAMLLRGDGTRPESQETGAAATNSPPAGAARTDSATPVPPAAATPGPPSTREATTRVAAPTAPPQTPTTTVTAAAPAPPPAAANGYLTVGANPWGTVLIDGVEIRNTPLTRHELAPGRYVIEVRRTGYATTTDTVVITAGNATILSKVLVPE